MKLDLTGPVQAVSRAGIEFNDIFVEKRRGVEVLFDVDHGVAPGNPCDPDNLPADIPPGMACQFSGEFVEKILPDRVMNAEKGDVFLSPGGSGVIGGLLRQVSPPQRYSHSGVFTRDRVEVAHSTAAEGWLEAQHSGGLWSPPFGSEPAPSDGFDPAALKYTWPGGVIQSAEEAVGGSSFQGPDGKDTGWAPHTVRGFFAGLRTRGVEVAALERVRRVGPAEARGRCTGTASRGPTPPGA